MGFQGMTAHWIEVKEGKWKMRAAVIGFKGLSGAHDGDNLGRYSVGLLDRVGIMNKTGSKACYFYFYCSRVLITFHVLIVFEQLYTATLDNTGNNNTTCKTIERIHVHRGLMWNSGEQQLPYVFYYFISNLHCSKIRVQLSCSHC
jgi:hypothetical protein